MLPDHRQALLLIAAERNRAQRAEDVQRGQHVCRAILRKRAETLVHEAGEALRMTDNREVPLVVGAQRGGHLAPCQVRWRGSHPVETRDGRERVVHAGREGARGDFYQLGTNQ